MEEEKRKEGGRAGGKKGRRNGGRKGEREVGRDGGRGARLREGDSQLLYSWQSLYGGLFPQPRGGPPASWAGGSVHPSMPATGPSPCFLPHQPSPAPEARQAPPDSGFSPSLQFSSRAGAAVSGSRTPATPVLTHSFSEKKRKRAWIMRWAGNGGPGIAQMVAPTEDSGVLLPLAPIHPHFSPGSSGTWEQVKMPRAWVLAGTDQQNEGCPGKKPSAPCQ